MQSLDLLIHQATLPDGTLASVGIQAGHISSIAPADHPLSQRSAKATLNIEGALLCPGLVDGHIHLDKTFLGAGWIPHIPGNAVRQRVEIEKQVLANLAVAVEVRAARLLELAISRGSTTLRTHVDIHPAVGLQNLDAILQVRDRYRDQVDIEIVAFPQSGVLSCPGTQDLLDAALTAGADLLGGLDPAGIDGDVAGQLDILFQLAERHGVRLDIHLHDPDHLGIFQLEQIVIRTKAHGMQGQVVVSHAYSLGMVPVEVADQTAEKLASADIAIMTNAPGHHPFPAIARLRSLGVTVFSGSDDIRNAWWPFGDADMLERAMLIAYRSNFRTDAELEMAFDLASSAGAKALGVKNYGVQIGARADLVVMRASSIAEAVVSRPPREWVLKAGQVVAKAGSLSTLPPTHSPDL